jgi:CrcB protein
VVIKEKELFKIAFVAGGGVIGSLARWLVSLGIVDQGFPWATLLVNYVGSVILTALVLYAKHHKSHKWWWRPALGTGFCGGFTTYSAFALKIDQYLSDGNIHSVLMYSLASLVGTYILVFATNELLHTKWVRK